MSVWTGFIWFRIQSSSGLLWTRQRNFGFCERRGIILQADRLSASQGGLCCTELVNSLVSL